VLEDIMDTSVMRVINTLAKLDPGNKTPNTQAAGDSCSCRACN